MTNPAPLSVDPEQLSAAGGQLAASAADLPPAPPPFMPVGSDPLSVAIIGQIPEIEVPVMTELPLVQTQSAKTAGNVIAAAQAYATTDQQLGGDIGKEMQSPPDAPGLGAGVPASGASSAGSMDQMMGIAGQVAQLPMQAMGAVTALPQGVMQGMQQVGQQVQQLTGQFGGGGQGSLATDDADERDDRDSAAAGQPGAERAPETAGKPDEKSSEATPPGRHRRAELSDDRIDL